MPFKLRLKKSRQYNVVSKNLFVITVELLDHSLIECTLSADSTGQECLYNVCQRVGLNQPEFFGLRFVYKHHGLRWVEMAKPLKKQLEKLANESISKLYLAVMFYISDVGQLHDEITRYQYFLQLKKDINEGHLSCTSEQAVLLTSYCLQAEFGNHDPEKHTAEYLTDFVLFPKHLTVDPQKLEELMSSVLIAHCKLQDLIPSAAEIRYIQEAQQLEGYGYEYFSAKDDLGKELLLGISVNGIVAKSLHTRITLFYKWEDISRLSHHRKYLYIESTSLASRNATYQLEDTETAKYIKKLCEQQRKFYKRMKSTYSSCHESDEIGQPPWKSRSMPNLQNFVNHTLVFDPTHANQLFHNREPHTVSDIQHALTVHPKLQYDEIAPYPISHAYSGNLGHGSAYSIDQLSHQSGVYSSEAQPLSSSNLSLHAFNRTQSQNYESHAALLPSYRPAPDYETAVQQKYGSLQHPDIPVPEVLSMPSSSHSYESALNVYNRMEHVGQVSSFPTSQVVLPQSEVKSYTHYKNFDNLAHLDDGIDSPAQFSVLHNGGGLVTNSLIGNVVFQQTSIHSQPHPISEWNTANHTYSTPELKSQGLASDITCEQLFNQYKPPPPYPYANKSSTSTPDLAGKGTGDRNGLVVGCELNVIHGTSSEVNLGRNELPVSQGVVHIADVPVNSSDVMNKSDIGDPYRSTDKAQTGILPGNSLLQHAVNSDVINKVLLALRDDKNGIGKINSDTVHRSRSSSTQSAPEVMKAVANACSKLHSDTLPAGGLDKSSRNVENADEKAVIKSKDSRCQMFENKLLEGSIFMEFDHIPKKLANADYVTSLLPDNASRNRFKDVLPYEHNRVRLTPTKDNKTGYINASHIMVTVRKHQRFYIAAQGPLRNTVVSFWQMVWEQNAKIIIMLTEVTEQGREKCYPYWPQGDNGDKLDFGEFQITRKFSSVSMSFITCSLTLTHVGQKKHRNLWHIQYTVWPDHSCPDDVHGFLAFMEEIDSVRRHAASELPPGKNRNVPTVVHCSAGVGRSGVTILCDVMIYCLDHNENVEVQSVLTELRQQRMLTVQTLAQYKFVYSVLIQYLKNSRLI